MWLRRSSRWLTSATLLATLGLTARDAAAETLTPQQALEKAAQQNPALKASLLDIKAAKLAVAAEQNARVPVLVAATSGEYTESIGPTDRTDSEAIRASTGVQLKTDVGTTIETGVQSDVVWRNLTGTTPASQATGPTFGTSLYLTARQPLLRGLGSDVVLAPLAQAESAAKQAEREQELETSQTALDVLSAYWELWYADRAVGVQERSLEVATKQVADAKLKAGSELGTGSQVDVLQFASSLASIKDSLSQAKTARATRAIALGRLLGVPADEAVLLATTQDAPSMSGAPPAKALRAALMAGSKELAALRAQVEIAEARLLVAKDADKPRLDAFGSFSIGANWATDDAYEGLGVAGGRPAFTVLAGLELEAPLGESRATSEAARARAQLDAAKLRYEARVDAIDAEAATLAVSLDSAQTQVDLAGERADIARQLAEAERARLVLGSTTPVNVVLAEQNLREAELRKLRAVVDQTTTQLSLEHTAGALLAGAGAAALGASQ